MEARIALRRVGVSENRSKILRLALVVNPRHVMTRAAARAFARSHYAPPVILLRSSCLLFSIRRSACSMPVRAFRKVREITYRKDARARARVKRRGGAEALVMTI